MIDPAENQIAAAGDAVRCALNPIDGGTVVKAALAKHYPAMAALGFQLRELVRRQLMTASEEIHLRPTEMFLGYSVHTYGLDPIFELTITNRVITLAFARGLPVASLGALNAAKDPASGALRITHASVEDVMILKILLREAGRTSRPRLPLGRVGHCFLMRESAA